MSHDNAKTIKDGLQKAQKIIIENLTAQMRENCRVLLGEIQKHRTFLGFTGNTQLSYMGALYVDGKLDGIVYNETWKGMPRYQKVRKGQAKYLADPFEGLPRFMRGAVDTDGGFGQLTSLKFLQSYNAPKGHICFVICTGTEYSEYLESVRHLDVLTGTFEAAKAILSQGFKPIPSIA